MFSDLEIIDRKNGKVYEGNDGFTLVLNSGHILSALKTHDGLYVFEDLIAYDANCKVFTNSEELLTYVEGLLDSNQKSLLDKVGFDGHIIQREDELSRGLKSLFKDIKTDKGRGKPGEGYYMLDCDFAQMEYRGRFGIIVGDLLVKKSKLEKEIKTAKKNAAYRKMVRLKNKLQLVENELAPFNGVS